MLNKKLIYHTIALNKRAKYLPMSLCRKKTGTAGGILYFKNISRSIIIKIQRGLVQLIWGVRVYIIKDV